MINLEQRIKILSALGELLVPDTSNAAYERAVHKAIADNGWFSVQNIDTAIQAIRSEFLNAEKLTKWANNYPLPNFPARQVVVGLVAAGNIPIVAFHDILAIFISGHRAQIKLSAKDTALTQYILGELAKIEPKTQHYFQTIDNLKGFDAVIATGSDNTARYFNYYFGKYPHIIRKHRNSAAILWGDETSEDIRQLGQDIFQYFGLGCRNVSKIYVPKDYDFVYLLDNLAPFADMMNHNKYKNNYDYYRSILLLNKEAHLASDFLMLVEKKSLASPVSVLHYEYYESEDDLANKLIAQKDAIQCIVSQAGRWGNCLPFGKAQQPTLNDYADQIDVMSFLLSI